MLLPFLIVFCVVLEAFSPTNEGLLTSSNASLLWGPYRPNLYFGIRPRIPNSLLMGLTWSNADDPSDILKNLRHTCEQDEGMAGYGWTAYDVRSGGMQIVNDTGSRLDLITHFAKDLR
ncbi:hypothetical protein GJ744_009108 [Endocarpon pusillum]|uniref:Mannosyl-oligosaccharide glucosidase n=1 Tax=Endocarpon pusillum TaxID=364733 RepID=A0A8H7AI57_9EURO|nr:hypothetical protein GJ744_009108 [Endocarpon pusillum]